MFFRAFIALFALSFTLISGAQTTAYSSSYNFPDRKALVINNCPFIELSGFFIGNAHGGRDYRFNTELKWKNLGKEAISAIEVVVLKYDAFDQRMIGTRWTVTGHNSANWLPLQPGEVDGDGLSSFKTEEVMTAIVYVRSARLASGAVWRASDGELTQKLKQAAPFIKDFGSIKPDQKPSPEAGK